MFKLQQFMATPFSGFDTPDFCLWDLLKGRVYILEVLTERNFFAIDK